MSTAVRRRRLTAAGQLRSPAPAPARGPVPVGRRSVDRRAPSVTAARPGCRVTDLDRPTDLPTGRQIDRPPDRLTSQRDCSPRLDRSEGLTVPAGSVRGMTTPADQSEEMTDPADRLPDQVSDHTAIGHNWVRTEESRLSSGGTYLSAMVY